MAISSKACHATVNFEVFYHQLECDIIQHSLQSVIGIVTVMSITLTIAHSVLILIKCAIAFLCRNPLRLALSPGTFGHS